MADHPAKDLSRGRCHSASRATKSTTKTELFLTGIFEAKFLDIQNTVAVNYAGVPALALPIPLPGETFPVTSIQLIGPPNSEAALLNIGRLIETKS